MTITPVNGTLLVSQKNQEFGQVYTSSFPDSPEGMKQAFSFASSAALGWLDCQDKDWEKHHAA